MKNLIKPGYSYLMSHKVVLTLLFILSVVLIGQYFIGDVEPEPEVEIPRDFNAHYTNPECEFVSKKFDGSPREIVQRFLSYDGEGNMLGKSDSTDSFDNYSICPVRQGGPDNFWAIVGSRIVSEDAHESKAIIAVEYDVLGNVTSSGLGVVFKPEETKRLVEFRLERTEFGWRIDFEPSWVSYVQAFKALDFHKNDKWEIGNKEKLISLIPKAEIKK
ncbi:hypothetical protein [Bdellovibrio sp. HCB209]|uniref:hypothetical protein n=1 Tax=Bdellovibrio sp. HCB209 TaxID=3394354 RepID=UPI0039B3BB5A